MSLDPFFNLSGYHGKYLDRYIDALTKIVCSGRYILGNEVKLFEEQFSQYLGNTGYACGVGNATDGLTLSALAFSKNQSKRKIITTPVSYIASTSSIFLSGYEPLFVDIDGSGNIDPKALESCDLTDVAGCLFVHYSGNPTNIQEVEKFCLEKELFLIEDCAQAMGSKVNGKYVGNFGNVAAFSFHPLKILGTIGDAGMVYTRSKLTHDYLLRARNHGHSTRDNVDFFSSNTRLDEIHAAFLRIQMEDLNSEIQTRQNQVSVYKSQLKNKGVEFLFEEKNAEISYNFFVVLSEQRDAILEKATLQGIELKIHYPRLLNHLSPIQNKTQYQCLKTSENLVGKIISLPVGSTVLESKIEKIISIF